MKILVTGAAGFFGSNLCEYLLHRGNQVVGVDNFNGYYSPAVKDYNIREIKNHENFSLYRTDILDGPALERVFETAGPFGAVVHLAAWAGVANSVEQPVTYIRNNIEGTSIVAGLAVKYGVDSFVFSSSSSIYGSNPVPFREDMPIVDPLSPYPVTKRSCELLLQTYASNFGLPVSIIRIFNPQGKRMRPDLALPKLVRSCEYGTEVPVYWPRDDWEKTGRDYCYIGHMLEAIDRLAANPCEFEIFNLGNSKPVTLGGLFRAVREVLGKEPRLIVAPKRQGELDMTYADIDKARRLLDYNPVTTIEESIHRYYEWYREQDEEYKRGEL